MEDKSTYKKDSKVNEKTLAQRWQTLDQKKSVLYSRAEDYALWTLPYIFPKQSHNKDSEMNGPMDSIGPRAVNNAANKLVMALFPPYAPFFRLNVTNDVIAELTGAAEQGDPDAKEIIDSLDRTLADGEKDAMRILDYNSFRTEATMAAKSLIVTGNSMMYHPEGAKAQTYSLRDYCVVRDLGGNVIEIMTRDRKAYGTFKKDVQEQISTANKGKKKYSADTEVIIYTQLKLHSDGKFHLKQGADDCLLDSYGKWTPQDLPYIVLTWNLVRGEDYGRGLVEDYAGAFHALTTLTDSVVTLIGITADIKFLVNPQSVLDVVQLNNSESGTYHSGAEGDITVPDFGQRRNIELIEATIARLQQQIGQAFLLNTSVTRDAERVTAEEIRYVAQELEISHGGIYSRFAEEWQLRLATLLLKRIDIRVGKSDILYPQIITGLDSLSRAGDLDNLRMFVADLQLLEGVPEDIRGVIDPMRFAQYIGVRRGVDYEKFTKTAQQMAQEQQAAMQMQEQQMQMQAAANVAESAGQSMVQQ